MFSEFQPINKAEWLEKINKDLKGKSISDLIIEMDGITFEPFHHLDDMEQLSTPFDAKTNWEIGEDIIVEDDSNKTNRKLIAALEYGVNAPRLVLDKNISYSNLAIVLEGVNLEMISLHFYYRNKNANPISLLTHFIKYISLKRIEESLISGSINFDYNSALNETELKELFKKIKTTDCDIKVVTIVDNDQLQGDVTGRLSALISNGEKILNRCISQNIPAEIINQHLQFSISIGKNYFLEIAKARALKLLWSNIMKAYKIHGALPKIEAHLSVKEQVEDTNKNMIASTSQTLSAIIGGASRITVLPSDYYAGQTSDFSNRIARNVQHLLKLECSLGRVADPAAGSYFIEKLSLLLAEKAWNQFTQN